MIIDTHCHLYSMEFATDIGDVIQRAIMEGVTRFYMPAIDSTTHAAMTNLEAQFPENCLAMIGLHPCSVKQNYKDELMLINDLLLQRKFAAIGETGLDFYWDKTYLAEQYLALETQAGWALQYDLPLIFHTRNATLETIGVIKNYASTSLRGIFHCFGGSLAEAMQIIETGFYLGIGGIITYKNSGMAELLKEVDIKHMVLETDAPYLTPVPYRGKRNESSYLKYIIKKLAEIKNITVDEVIDITTQNAKAVFSKP